MNMVLQTIADQQMKNMELQIKVDQQMKNMELQIIADQQMKNMELQIIADQQMKNMELQIIVDQQMKDMEPQQTLILGLHRMSMELQEKVQEILVEIILLLLKMKTLTAVLMIPTLPPLMLIMEHQ